ncbi:MAG: FG-GAP repeat domain-containing protein [Sumerlaeia bacterium]
MTSFSGRPIALSAGDFNGDNITDLATANVGSASVMIGNEDPSNPGKGDGTFAPQVNYPVGSQQEGISTVDFNGDGITDIVTTSKNSDTVSVLLGNGIGGVGDVTFSPQITYPVGDFPIGVATTDFNDDGSADIVVANSNDSTISILLNTGDGAFTPQVIYPAGRGVRKVITTDYNRDGITDIIAANNSGNSISLFTGNGSNGSGDGTFETSVPPPSYPAGDRPVRIANRDLNGDGITDIVVANSTTNSLSVLLGNGTQSLGEGTFAPIVAYSVGVQPSDVVIEDINQDGMNDIIAANAGSNSISVLLGNGFGGIGDGSFAPHVTYSVVDRPESVLLGDFNSDGILDVITANINSDDISVLIGIGDGSFASQVNYFAGELSSNAPFAVGDFNQDGISDIILSNSSSQSIAVLLGNGSAGVGNGTFATPVFYSVGIEAIAILTEDFNSDGILDIVTAN